MPRKKKEPTVPTDHEREVALEEKEVLLEERKLAVWKQKFDFFKSAGRDTVILITGLVGTLGGGAIRTYLERLFPADEEMGPVPPIPKPGDVHEIMPPPPVAPIGQVTLTPPNVLFGKGHGSGSGAPRADQYDTTVQYSIPPRNHRNKTLYMAGHVFWAFFMLLVVWGVWKHFRKGKKDGAPTDTAGKPTGTS